MCALLLLMHNSCQEGQKLSEAENMSQEPAFLLRIAARLLRIASDFAGGSKATA